MSNYISAQDISDRMGQARIDALCANSGISSANMLEKASENATSLIDGYLSAAYVLPLSGTPAALRNIAVDLAEYELYKLSSSPSIPEKIKDSYKEATLFLEKLSDGSLRLDESLSSRKEKASVLLTSSDSLMDAESMKGF